MKRIISLFFLLLLQGNLSFSLDSIENHPSELKEIYKDIYKKIYKSYEKNDEKITTNSLGTITKEYQKALWLIAQKHNIILPSNKLELYLSIFENKKKLLEKKIYIITTHKDLPLSATVIGMLTGSIITTLTTLIYYNIINSIKSARPSGLNVLFTTSTAYHNMVLDYKVAGTLALMFWSLTIPTALLLKHQINNPTAETSNTIEKLTQELDIVNDIIRQLKKIKREQQLQLQPSQATTPI